MEQVLKNLPKGEKDETLLVGYDTSDDAAIYKISDDLSIVNTLDFFPPMIEDPYIFGQVAATNALSDIYAMGGKPITAMNIVCFPTSMDINLLEKILKGGAEKVIEAGCSLCGGHSIDDSSVKYGLAVTGLVDTKKVLKNNGVKVGDKLLLTKPLGAGILTTAIKCEVLTTDSEDYNILIKYMTALNKYAAEVITKYNVHALTDVTGFGLLIHTDEMLCNNASANIYDKNIPLMTATVEKFAKDEYVTGASARNKKAIDDKVDFSNMEEWKKQVLYDPQTSGGLLASIDSSDIDKVKKELDEKGIFNVVIGEIIEKSETSIFILNNL